MPQGPNNAAATFNRCVTHLLSSVRDFAPSYFDDVYVHSRAVNEKTDIEMHKEHSRELLGLMRKHKVYANLKKCIFVNGLRHPSNVKELRQFLGLATYLCKYVDNYAGKIRPLSQLLKKEAAWKWSAECQLAFDAVKQRLTEASILAVADQYRPFHVVCDASDFAIGCALMQLDREGRDRVLYYHMHSRSSDVYLLGNTPFVVYTDHASLRTAVKSPHISQRMARWLSFFAEYNFRVEYKPGRLNVVTDALSRRPDYAVKTVAVNRIDLARTYTPSSSLMDEVKAAFAHDTDVKQLIEFLSVSFDQARRKSAPCLRVSAHRYRVPDGLLFYCAVNGNADRIVCRMIMICAEGSCTSIMIDLYWNHPYKWMRKYVRTCDVCQQVKPAPHSQDPLQPLPAPSECWESVSMDFVLGLPRDSRRKAGIVVFVECFSKMMHLAAVAAEMTSVQTARLFVDMVLKHHGMRSDFVSDRDPCFTVRFWQEVFTLYGTQFSMSTADHPQTDGQTERMNHVLVDLLKSYTQSFHNWSDYLPMAEFAINNAVHASTGHTPFFVNAMRHPPLPSTLGAVASSLTGGGSTVASEQPQKTADTEFAAAMIRARARARTRQSDVSVPGTDTVKNHEQATPAPTKDNVS
ncbi:Retrovirus Polyprotein, partial [Phytophthora megakarya]